MPTANRHSKRWRPSAAVFAALLALAIAGCSSSNSSNSSGGQSSATGGGTATGTTATGTPVKIGYICLCTNVGASSSALTLGAFTDWTKWANAHGGINGHPIQLITGNDPGNPGIALSQVKQLVAQGIIALAANDASDGSAWASYIQSTGIPVIDTTSGSLSVDMSLNTFTPLVSLLYQPAEVVAAAKKAGSTKMAVFYCAELALCKQSVPAFTAAAQTDGVKIPFSTSVLSTSPNYTAQCLAAKGAGADSLFIAAISQTTLQVVASCAQQGYKPHLVSSAGAYQQSFAGAPGTDGMIASESTVPFFDTSNPQIQIMTAAFNQYSPGLTASAAYSDVAVWQWTSGMLIAAAAKAGGVGAAKPLTGAAMLDGFYALRSTNLGGLTPTLTFVKGQQHFNKCWYYAALQNGKFGTPFGLTPTCAPAAGLRRKGGK